MSCQDEKGHDACAQPTEAKLGAEEEKRPETHFNDVETLTAPPEVTSRSAACNCFQNNTQYSTVLPMCYLVVLLLAATRRRMRTNGLYP